MTAPLMPEAGRVYDSHLNRTVDGDTIDVIEFKVLRLRLLGVDTPERKESGYAEASAFTDAFCRSLNQPLRVQTAANDNFGRELAWVWDSTGVSLNDALLAAGLASPYGVNRMIAEARAGRLV